MTRATQNAEAEAAAEAYAYIYADASVEANASPRGLGSLVHFAQTQNWKSATQIAPPNVTQRR